MNKRKNTRTSIDTSTERTSRETHDCYILVYDSDNSDTYTFISLKTQMLCYYNLHCPRYISHILHRNFSGSTFQFPNLKALIDSGSFVSWGTKSHFLDLDWTRMPCHIRQNLLHFFEENCYYKGHKESFMEQKVSS